MITPSPLMQNNCRAVAFAWRYWRRFGSFQKLSPNWIQNPSTFSAGCDNHTPRRSYSDGRAYGHTKTSKESKVESSFVILPSHLKASYHGAFGRATATRYQNQIRFMSAPTDKSKVDFSTLDTITPPSSTHSLDTNQEDKKPELTTKEKAKQFLKKYGFIFIGTYASIYFTTLLSIFGLLEGGFLDPDLMGQVFKVSKDLACETADVIGPTGSGVSMDEAASAYATELSTEMTEEKRSLVDIVTGYLQKYEWSAKYAEKLEQNPHLANFAVAWFLVKFTEPVRLATAFVVVPKVAKAMGRTNSEENLKGEVNVKTTRGTKREGLAVQKM